MTIILKKNKLPNFNFGQTSVAINRLINKSLNLANQPGASQSFNFIDYNNQITFPGETFVDITFNYDKILNKYSLLLGIVPRETGVYCISFLGASELEYNGIIDLGKSKEGAIIFPVFDKIYFPINDGVNNYQMFKNNCLAGYTGLPEEYGGYYSEFKGTFTFRVVE